jgi:hypothetical protein
MAFFGEVNKWIGASAVRLLKLSTSTTSTNNNNAIKRARQRQVPSSSKASKKKEEEEEEEDDDDVDAQDDDGSSYVVAEMVGVAGEMLSVGFVNADLSLVVVECEISQTGRVKVSPSSCSSQI